LCDEALNIGDAVYGNAAELVHFIWPEARDYPYLLTAPLIRSHPHVKEHGVMLLIARIACNENQNPHCHLPMEVAGRTWPVGPHARKASVCVTIRGAAPPSPYGLAAHVICW